MLGSRRRLQPPASVNALVHKILAVIGLGPDNDSDVEVVCPIADRLSFTQELFTAAGAGQQVSAWFSCQDRSVIRIAVEYAASTGSRELLVALKGYDDLVLYTRILEADNSGLSVSADLYSPGYYKAVGGGVDNIDCRGMKSYRVVLLARTSGVLVSMRGGVA